MQSVVLFASGADTYTWSNGTSGPTATMTASPLITTTFSVSGTHTASGCVSMATIPILVNPSPNVALLASDYTVCSGNTVLLSAFGANSYSWSTNVLNTNQIAITPTVSATYSVMGANSFGCKDSAYVNIAVLPEPLLNAVSAQDTICAGQSVNLMVLVAQSYTWTNGAISLLGSTVQVSPVVTTVYTVTGTDSLGCSNSLALVQTVLNCVFEKEIKANIGLNVFPNPVGDFLYIRFDSEHKSRISVLDAFGKCLEVTEISALNAMLDFQKLNHGLYFLKVETEGRIEVLKVIKD
jgi:hypothetical protein